MTTFAVYAYMLPYKEMFVNIIELFFQLCFMIFLLLRSTQSILNDYLVFPSDHDKVLASYESDECSNETGTANLTWLLLPFAYLPLIMITVIFSVKILILLNKHMKVIAGKMICTKLKNRFVF